MKTWDKLNEISVLFSGAWSARSISIKERISSRRIDEILEVSCRKSWQANLNEAARAGKQLWDSDIYRFESVSLNQGLLNLVFSTVPFSIRLGMNSHVDQVKKLGVEYASRGIFSSCFIQTADGQLIFIEKSDKYFTKKRSLLLEEYWLNPKGF